LPSAAAAAEEEEEEGREERGRKQQARQCHRRYGRFWKPCVRKDEKKKREGAELNRKSGKEIDGMTRRNK